MHTYVRKRCTQKHYTAGAIKNSQRDYKLQVIIIH